MLYLWCCSCIVWIRFYRFVWIFQEYSLLSFPILYKKATKVLESMSCVLSSILKHHFLPSIWLSLFLHLTSKAAQAETCCRCNLAVGLRKNSPLAEGTHREVLHKELQSCLHAISSPLKRTHPKTPHPRLNDLSV